MKYTDRQTVTQTIGSVNQRELSAVKDSKKKSDRKVGNMEVEEVSEIRVENIVI